MPRELDPRFGKHHMQEKRGKRLFKHSSEKTKNFKFQSFTERIKNVDTDIAGRTGSINLDPDRGNDLRLHVPAVRAQPGPI